jgi:hypothetical protein
MAFTQPWFEIDFGAAYGGLLTVGYRLYKADATDSVARTTVGVVDLSNGGYGVASVSVPDDAVGIEWDTGGGGPVYARYDIDPYRTRAAIRTDIAALNDLTAQDVRDAMKLTPSAGDPAINSVDEHLDDIFVLATDIYGDMISASDVWDTPLPGAFASGRAGYILASLQSLAIRAAGLVGENQVIAVLTRDAANNPLTQRIRHYDSLANAQTDDGITGLLDAYLATATYTAENRLDTYEVVRVGS